jgi:hypothetical protein
MPVWTEDVARWNADQVFGSAIVVAVTTLSDPSFAAVHLAAGGFTASAASSRNRATFIERFYRAVGGGV